MQPDFSEPVIEPGAGGDPIKRALEEKLRSQYRIVRLLGRGGMGTVYLARDLTLEREVAIKVLNTASSSREQYDRFRREARTAAKLSHPNIVPLHAFGEVEGMPYFVMGYIRGESLAARLAREGRVDEDEARRILGEIAHALDHAHRIGVIHRDIKPDNVLLDDETGRALLTDFGVAKAVGLGETLTQSGGVIGTPHYMSPEQASGEGAIDARSDLYSLGVMGYAMLAGRLPFEGKTAADVLTKHLTQQPPPLRSLVPAVSDSTVQVVERCLAKDPAARWPDARSLSKSLGAMEVNQLPDSLHAVEGRGIPAVVFGVLGLDAFYFATMLAARALRDEGGVQFLGAWPLESGLVNAMFIIGVWSSYYAFVIMRLRREGFSVRQSQSVIWREPSWWLFWYPRALRRSGNIWDRLPATVRHFRVWNIALVLLLLVAPFIVFHTGGKSLSYDEANITMAVIAAITVLWFVLRSVAMGEVRRKGLDSLDSFRVLLTVAPSRVAFWARPHIAAILAPVERAEQPGSGSPHDHLQSILRHGNELSGPVRPLGVQAAVAARQLIAAIEQSDREIADLMRNIEPNEETRLVDKIEALAGDEAAPLRTLLEQQLELIRDLSARVEEANQRRNRRVEMIKMLSLHIASLRARVTETPSEIRHLSENVRALCEEIRRQGPAPGIGSDEMATRPKISV
ncbi:MAG TPA: serine/threonine-protein kinase [Thermoanaerobaculia bacterium]|nr:serine/threonine-protein kinase [Thermoanaerobaculia bacterium]